MYVPVSTYRLQLHAGFAFDAATELVEYLAQLGIGACYTSPYFAARPGSTHGYDVSNHNAINPELGGPDAHARFVRTASVARPRAHGRLRSQSHGDWHVDKPLVA